MPELMAMRVMRIHQRLIGIVKGRIETLMLTHTSDTNTRNCLL